MNLPTLLTALAIAAGSTAAAADWTFNDCMRHARENSITLLKARLSEQTAEIDVESAKGNYEPTLDFASSHNYSNAPWGHGNKNSYTGNIGLNAGWTLYDGGSRSNTLKSARLKQEAQQGLTTDVERSLLTEILSAYFNILYAREAVTVYEEAAKLSGAQTDRARQLMGSGRLSRVDYAQLSSQHEQDIYNLVNARGTLDTRMNSLKRTLELKITEEFNVASADWTDAEVMAPLPDKVDTYMLALATDERLRSLNLDRLAAEADIKTARATGRPKISLNAGIGTGWYAPGESFGTQLKQSVNESAGLTLSVPILDGKKAKTAVARANVQLSNTVLDIDSRENDLSQSVESWYTDTTSAQARFQAASEQVTSAELTDRLVNEQFTLGLVNTVELMQAHNDLLQARHSRLQAKYMAILGQKMIEFYRTASVTMPN